MDLKDRKWRPFQFWCSLFFFFTNYATACVPCPARNETLFKSKNRMKYHLFYLLLPWYICFFVQSNNNNNMYANVVKQVFSNKRKGRIVHAWCTVCILYLYSWCAVEKFSKISADPRHKRRCALQTRRLIRVFNSELSQLYRQMRAPGPLILSHVGGYETQTSN